MQKTDMSVRKVCTLVGKGPSAVQADGLVEGDIAVINNAGLFVPTHPVIEFCFFTDIELIRAAQPYWSKTKKFVSPNRLHENAIDALRHRSWFPS